MMFSSLYKINNNMLAVKNVTFIELRQYKNDSIQSKIIQTLKLPLFFTTYTVREKARQFQNWNYFWLNGIALILSLLFDFHKLTNVPSLSFRAILGLDFNLGNLAFILASSSKVIKTPHATFIQSTKNRLIIL